MQNVAWTFHLRWIFWGGGCLFLLLWVLGLPNRYRIKIEKTAERHFLRILFIICGSFFFLAVLGKYSQLWSFNLNSQDFWLFVDILEHLKGGAAFLTRFAPQDLGVLQHGSVHPMFSWGLLLPFSWIIGSVNAALIFNPAMLTLGGGMIAVLARKKWGAYSALLFCCAFLASTQVGKILMYDVHPEAAYPFFVLLWLWSLGLDGSKQVRWVTLVLSVFLGAGVKEDSFLVIGPWLLWGLLSLKGRQRKAVLVSGAVAGLGFLLQVIMVKNWISGAWGPAVWEGVPVVTRAGVGLFKGSHWTGISDILTIAGNLISDQGGFLGLLKNTGSFLVSRPWLSLLILAPWVVLEGRFWLVLLPLASVYSLLDTPRVLWTYYSAPLLASFWFCAASPDRMRAVASKVGARLASPQNFASWACCAAFLLGSGTVQIFRPSQQAQEIKKEANALLPCLKNRGIVQSHLLGLVPLERVWTDRMPRAQDQWSRLDFVLFSPELDRFEMTADVTRTLFADLAQRKDWQRVGESCQPVFDPLLVSKVVLFVRSNPTQR